ncbi:MAG: hypothetical protein Q4E53_06260 [Eubacteriales bacterium]|nr:hypothetical protein [Eubacteriales bacterium]
MLWERYPKYHEKKTFTSLADLLEDHESYQKDFDDELKEEYIKMYHLLYTNASEKVFGGYSLYEYSLLA